MIFNCSPALMIFNPSSRVTCGILRSSNTATGLPPARVLKLPPMVKIIQRLLTVVYDDALVGRIVFRQSGQRQFHAEWIVFDQQNVSYSRIHFIKCASSFVVIHHSVPIMKTAFRSTATAPRKNLPSI